MHRSRALCLLVLSSFCGVACGDDAAPAPSSPAPVGGDASTGLPEAGGSAAVPVVDGAAPAPVDGGAPWVPPPAPADGGSAALAFDYEAEAVSLSADLVIPAGKTVHVGPGVTFTAQGKDVKVQVDGTLIVDGSEASPSKFLGTRAEPRSWRGIVVGPGGALVLRHAVVSGAEFALHALAGSNYAVSDSTLEASFKAAVVESYGTFERTRFKAAPSITFSLTNEVTANDENGTLTILNASPAVSHSLFDGASAFVDMVRVGGNSTPTFDHVHVRNAHCAFHTNGAVANSPRITNSIIEGQSYGVMAYRAKPVFENCVFKNNSNDFGFCFDATSAEAPTLKGNFYAAGAPAVDSTCFQIGTKEPSPATSAPAGVGPVGLSF
jgi:hypothetical protein